MCGIGISALYLCPNQICNSMLNQNFEYTAFGITTSNYTILNNDFPLPNTNCQCGGTGYIGLKSFCAKSTDQCIRRYPNFYQCVTNKITATKNDYCPNGFLCNYGNFNSLSLIHFRQKVIFYNHVLF